MLCFLHLLVRSDRFVASEFFNRSFGPAGSFPSRFPLSSPSTTSGENQFLDVLSLRPKLPCVDCVKETMAKLRERAKV